MYSSTAEAIQEFLTLLGTMENTVEDVYTLSGLSIGKSWSYYYPCNDILLVFVSSYFLDHY